eukprot:Partr_v1_DN25789_c0_g1_i7_m74554 putative Ceramide glucosyltransferase
MYIVQHIMEIRKRRYSPPSAVPVLKQTPGVSILRPLCGLDVNLEANIESSFQLKYSNYEVILCLADPNDPALLVAKKVIEAHPDIPSRLITEAHSVGVNPKINNLMRGYMDARNDIIWVCDSNIYMDPDTLLYAVDGFSRPGVGLVHHTPQGTAGRSWGARLDELFLNTAHAKIYLVVNWADIYSCVIGKSTLFRRSLLEQVGGLASFGRYMAEDNMIGMALRNLGVKHYLSEKTALQPLNDTTITEYINRRSRWTRIRAYSMPVVTLIEPFFESICCGGVASLGVAHVFGLSAPIFFAAHMLLWLTIDWFLMRNLTNSTETSVWAFTSAWFLREVSCIPIYIYAIFGSNEVRWRGKSYSLKLGGTVESISLKQQSSFFLLDLAKFIISPFIGDRSSPPGKMWPKPESP